MTEIVVTDCNLNSVCERLEERCCVDEPPAPKSHSNTGAKLWGRVRSKLLRQKVLKSSPLLLETFSFSQCEIKQQALLPLLLLCGSSALMCFLYLCEFKGQLYITITVCVETEELFVPFLVFLTLMARGTE